MKIGIIGPQGSGKSAVLSCLTGTDGSVNIGVVGVPDPRLEVLSGMYKPRKTTQADITFAEIGCASASKLSAITGALSQTDALAVVTGGFAHGTRAADLDSFLLDLLLADMSVVENRLARIEEDRQRGKKESQAEKPLMERLQKALADGVRLENVEVNADEEKALRAYQFVTRKPTLVVANVAEGDLGNGVASGIAETARQHGLRSLELCAPLEGEIARLTEEDRAAFLADYGLDAPARDRFIRAAYELTDLISFFTVGPDECKAWSIRRGTLAPRAAGAIHSDIERGFIRAEVVAYEDLVASGSLQECRARGQVRLEGKTYEVRDGDVIDFRFAV
ncbi:MAG: redox-regulated ATPase YchF [Armatimonadetes bacterium]|nr:redox-regulated ATPase YchF [Armatimonadota bacterium]